MKRTIRIPGALVLLALCAPIAGPAPSAAGADALASGGRQEAGTVAAGQDQASDIGTVIITRSGIGRRDKTTEIRYRKSDLTIVAVTDNGKAIPPDRLDRYRDELMKALEYPKMRSLLERIDEVKKAVESMPLTSPEQRVQFDKLLNDLAGFSGGASPAYESVLDPRYRELMGVVFQRLVRAVLAEGRLLSPGEDVRLVLKTTGCALNGRPLLPAASEEVLALWEKCFGTPVKADEQITYIFDPDNEAGERGPLLR